MLSDEEKKAIKILKINPEIIADLDEEMFEKMCEFKEKSIKELKYWASQKALNLIEKQSKEIEKLKDIKQKICNEELLEQEYVKENFIHKDKIKAKIEEYDDKGMTVNLANRSAGKTFQQAVHYEVKKVLQSLLEKE